MRLTFPNGEHPDVVEPGRITLGSGSDSRVRLPGLVERHAVLANDRRGIWLVIESSEATAHVNARPVSRLALVRAGDLISLGQTQMLLRSDADPVEPKLPQASAASTRATAANSTACPERFLLRGVSGAHYGRSFPLIDPVIVGRGDSATLRLDEPTLLDRHARVELHNDCVVLRDLSSGPGEGTRLNGVKVRNAILVGGDQVAWENNRYVVEAPGLTAPVRRHDSTPLPGTANPPKAITQTMRPVTSVQVAADIEPAPTSSVARKASTVWWLVLAAALLGAGIAALLVFAPKLGS